MALVVKYYDIPDGIQENTSVEASGGMSLADPELIVVGSENKAYATMEKNIWVLDGSRKLVNAEQNSFQEWYSQSCSDENGQFVQPPVITLQFSQSYTASGISFFFSKSTGQWCARVAVIWYNGNTVLHSYEARPDGPAYILEQAVEGFDRIEIRLLETNKPLNYAKIQKIMVGQEIVFGKEELVSVSVLNEVDPTLCELSVDEMTVRIKNKDEKNLIPQKNQQMVVFRDNEHFATQYITNSRRLSKMDYEFTCQSVIGLLEDTFDGGIYNAVPVGELLDAVLGSKKYSLHPKFQDVTVTGYLPICTRRVALQQIAFAIGAIVTTQMSDRINLIPVPDGDQPTGGFARNEVMTGSTMDAGVRLAYVQVMAHGYQPDETQETLLNEEPVDGENVRYTFSDPHHSYEITGGTITESGPNYVCITASGTVTVTGKSYIHTTQALTKHNPLATEQEKNNYLIVDGVTILDSTNAKEALDRLYDVSLYRRLLDQRAVINDGQLAGQVVTTPSPWDTTIRGYILSMSSTLTQQRQLATLRIAGMEHPVDGVQFYAGDVYSGESKGVVY